MNKCNFDNVQSCRYTPRPPSQGMAAFSYNLAALGARKDSHSLLPLPPSGAPLRSSAKPKPARGLWHCYAQVFCNEQMQF